MSHPLVDVNAISDISNLRIDSATPGSRKRRPSDDEHKERASTVETRTLKRYKSGIDVDEKAIRERLSSTSITPSLDKVLASLDKPQLLDILQTLLSAHPSLAAPISAMLPRPTLQSVGQILSGLEKRLNDAFPYTKWGRDTGDYSFNRVRPHLLEIRDMVCHYLLFFSIPSNYPAELEHEYPVTVMTFLHQATSMIHRLPSWENQMHNAEFKQDLYLKLGTKWREAISEIGRRVRDEGKVFGAGLITEWGKSIQEHAQQTQGQYGFSDALQLYKRELGWLVGVFPDPDIEPQQIRNGDSWHAASRQPVR